MTAWVEVSVIVLLVFAIIIPVTFFIGKYRIKLEKATLIKKIVNGSPAKKGLNVEFKSLNNLPIPVQKYFRYVLTDGLPFIKTTWLQQNGELKLSPKSKGWSTFKATQIISQNSVSFLWDATITVVPPFYVRVMDSLIEANGAGNVFLMSAISIGSDKDKPELNSGSLYRYLAEATWHPTALLPQSGVIWEPVDEYKAIAHFTKFNMPISLEFEFNGIGEIVGIYTEDRYGKFGDKYTQYPWEGRFSDYKEFNGIKIPTIGEVGWHLPEGWWLFWKGNIVDVNYEFNE